MRMTFAGLAACSVLFVACGAEPEDPQPVIRPIKIMTVDARAHLVSVDFQAMAKDPIRVASAIDRLAVQRI